MTAGRLEGRVALITGAATGIGRAVLERYVHEGALVGALERSAEGAQELRDSFGDSIVVTHGDVRTAGDHARAVQATLDRFGSLDVLVANAGIWDYARRLDEYERAEALSAAFDEVFAVNVRGCLLAAAASRPALVSARGAMIFTASSSSRHAGGGGPVYVASKHALVGLVRQLAFELAPDVRVNAVAPGATNTPLRGPAALGLDRARLDEARLYEHMAHQLPLGFVSEPADHADLYVLLASRSESAFMTSAVLASDGGLDVRGGGRRRRSGPAAKGDR